MQLPFLSLSRQGTLHTLACKTDSVKFLSVETGKAMELILAVCLTVAKGEAASALPMLNIAANRDARKI